MHTYRGSQSGWLPGRGEQRTAPSFRPLGRSVVLVIVLALLGLVYAHQVRFGSVSGRVTDVDGRPLASIPIRVRPLELFHPASDEVIKPVDRERVVLTGRDGRYRVRGLHKRVRLGRDWGSLPQDYELVADGEGYAPKRVVVHVRNGSVKGVDFVLEVEASLEGRLVDTLGRVCADREVRLMLEGLQVGKPFVVQPAVAPGYVRTDAEGRFEYESLSPGWYALEAVVFVYGSVIAQRAGLAPLRLRSGESVGPLDFPIEASEDWGSLEGNVVDAESGAVVPEFRLRVLRSRAPGVISPLLGRYERGERWVPFEDYGEHREPPVFEEGEFSIVDLSPGAVTLEVTAIGYEVQRSSVTVSRQGSTRVVVRMVPDRTLKEAWTTTKAVGSSPAVSVEDR